MLIVEDDAPLAAMIASYLVDNGLAAVVERRGDRVAQRVASEQPDLVVLDLALPGLDGLSACRKVRLTWDGPILMLTARGEPADEVAGLETGADDYVVKPVRPRILLARIRALLRRRTSRTETSTRLRVGALVIDPAGRTATICGADLALTEAELDLLVLLASEAGKVLDRRLLHERLLGTPYDRLERSVDLRVSRLRHKLLAAGAPPETIRSVRGVGYALSLDP